MVYESALSSSRDMQPLTQRKLPVLSAVFAVSAALLWLTPASRAALMLRDLFPAVRGPVSALVRSPSASETDRNRAAYHIWQWSLASVAASQALDGASSWGMRELNPVPV